MSFFKASKSKEDLKQGGGSGHINASGAYPVHIIAPFANTSQNGSTTVDMFIEHESQKQVIYGNLRITNNDGSPNVIGAKVFNQLVIISGVDEVSEPIDAELPIGKAGKSEDAAVLEDLCELDVIMRVQMEYSVYNGNIQEKKVIKAFYRAEDYASAEEIVNETEPGAQFAKEEKYLDNVTYKDGLTAADIEQWIKDQRPKGTGGGAKVSKTDKKPSFGKKKSFGK